MFDISMLLKLREQEIYHQYLPTTPNLIMEQAENILTTSLAYLAHSCNIFVEDVILCLPCSNFKCSHQAFKFYRDILQFTMRKNTSQNEWLFGYSKFIFLSSLPQTYTLCPPVLPFVDAFQTLSGSVPHKTYLVPSPQPCLNNISFSSVIFSYWGTNG